MRFWVVLLALTLTACATKMGRDGQRQTTVEPRYLAKTEIDRMADAARGEVVENLMLIADKLYKRNPREWKKSAASREAALERLKTRTVPAELGGKREGPAALQAFREEYAGDRVAALMYGLLTMADAAFGYKDDFYLFDSLDEQQLYNFARNLEIALWKLNSARTAGGQPLIVANELDPNNANLSFEREFGRIIGLLDFFSHVIADKNGRTVTRFTQSVATAIFLPVGLLK